MFCSFSNSSEAWYGEKAVLGLKTGLWSPFQTEKVFTPSRKYKILYSRTGFYRCVPWELPGGCRKLSDLFVWLSESLEVSLELNFQGHYPLNKN